MINTTNDGQEKISKMSIYGYELSLIEFISDYRNIKNHITHLHHLGIFNVLKVSESGQSLTLTRIWRSNLSPILRVLAKVPSINWSFVKWKCSLKPKLSY